MHPLLIFIVIIRLQYGNLLRGGYAREDFLRVAALLGMEFFSPDLTAHHYFGSATLW